MHLIHDRIEIGAVVIFMDTPIGRNFALRLRQLREAVGYQDQKDLAKALDVLPGTYGRWERGETQPNYDMLIRICTILGVTPTFILLGRTAEMANLLAAKLPKPKPPRAIPRRVSRKRNIQ